VDVAEAEALSADIEAECRDEDDRGGVYRYRSRWSGSNDSSEGEEDAGGGGGVSSHVVGAWRSKMDAWEVIDDERCRRQAAHGFGRT
jgi:hypothetical protein